MVLPALAGRLRALAPGLMLCAVIALAAAFIHLRWGGPPVLLALLVGMAFHEFSAADRQRPGVDFAAQGLLRLGIGLLGARITTEQVGALGGGVIGFIVLGVGSTMVVVAGLVRLAGHRWRVGLIAAGATAICGASAALAIAAIWPREHDTDARTVAIVVCATALSTVSMIGYPLLCSALALPPLVSGVFLGGSIHDVAQVAVAGYALGPTTGDMAVVVKLTRVALLTLVVVAIASVSRTQGPRWRLPWFLVLFGVLMCLQSVHALPQAAGQALGEFSQACLVTAAAALGMRSTVQLLRQAGWRLLGPMLVGSLWLAGLMLAGGWWLLAAPAPR